MNIFSKTTKVVIALALAGSVGFAFQAFADSKHKGHHGDRDTSPIQLKVTGVKAKAAFATNAAAKANDFDFYAVNTTNFKPGHYHKDAGKSAWLSQRKISTMPDMTRPGPQVTQTLGFTSGGDLEAVAAQIDQ